MNRTASIMVLGLIVTFIMVHPAYAQIESIAASVKATQGTAQLTPSGEQTPKPITRGGIVSAWDTVATDEKSKLLLSWKDGFTTSMGEFSSLLLASDQAQDGVMPSVQVINGVFRFSSQPSGSSSSEYSVTTPVATIYPASFDQPTDFTVEVYDPKSAAITVLAGNLKVRKLNGEESTIPSCHSVSIEEGKAGLNAMTLSSSDFAKLMDATTIPGTLVADVGPCAVVSEAAPPQPAPTYVAEYPSDYYVEDWEEVDMMPYFDVAVSVYDGGYDCFIPGIGRWVIDIPYHVDPSIIRAYLRWVLWDRSHHWYRNYFADARHREGELRNLLYLARASGNTNLLMQTQRRLDDLAVRSDWASRRLGKLDKMGRTLEADQRKLSGKLPSGVDLKQAISDSFYTRKNQQTARKFENRLKSSTDVETRLAGLTGQEMASLRDRIAKEPNTGKRLALAQELSQIKNAVANGKLVIPKSQRQVAELVDQIKKNPGAERQAQLENRLLSQIKAPRDSRRTSDLVNQERLASLKNDLTRLPDPQGRKILENRLTALEQSVQARQQAESNAALTRKKIDEVSKQVAREESPAKRQELLGKINELSKSMTPGGPRTSQFLEKPRPGTTQALERAKKEPSLKELETRGQAEAKRQELLKQQQAQEQRLRQQALEKEKRSRQARQEELRKRSALKQQEQLKQQQARQQELRQQALEKEKRGQQARQEELRKQSALKQQQLKQQQAQQQRLRQQALEKEKRSQQARQEELRKRSALKQQEQLKRQQAQQQQLRQQALQKEKRSQQARQEELRRQSALKQQQAQQQQLRQQQAQQQRLRQQQAQQQALRQQQVQQQALRQQQAQQQALQQQRLQQMRQRQARPQTPSQPQQPGKGRPQLGQVEVR